MKKWIFPILAVLAILTILPVQKSQPQTQMLVVGDSRTLGLAEYGDLPDTHYFASMGMRVRDVMTARVSVPSVGKMTLSELLSCRRYGTICLMLGVNELDAAAEDTLQAMQQLLSQIRRQQPRAEILILGNLHVTAQRSREDPICNNSAIDRLNEALSQLAYGKNVRYLDPNLWADDASGALDPQKAADSAHLTAQGYLEWSRWLTEKARFRRKEGEGTP